MTRHHSLEQQWSALLDQKTTIEILMTRYPEVWGEVKDTVGKALRSERPDHINELILKADASVRHWYDEVRQVQRGSQRSRLLSQAVPTVVRSRMIHLALKKVLTAQIGGDQPVRQSVTDRWLCNFLIYSRYRSHQPVNAFAMRCLWPLVRDKRAAIAVGKRLGMYCFYSDKLIALLAQRFAGKTVVEIAAGNGILSLLLARRGVRCIATDDMSWGHAVRFGHHVEDLDATAALKKYRPEAVICSWPPPQNGFEHDVFTTPSVADYVVIGSRHQFATGARSAYDTQAQFTCRAVSEPSVLAGPPEVESEILWFTRKS